jgi:hypothetical protein
MLIPRFSLKWLLALMTVSGVVAYVLAQAVSGKAWGVGVSVACGALVLTGLVHAVVFVLAHAVAQIGGSRQSRATSPFATHVAPPQILPPQDPD